ncbi:MAG: hypothetical protein AAF307_06455 [Pseudomonadota bacterium]
MTVRRTLICALGAVTFGGPVLAEPDLRLIVNRMSDSVEIYAAIVASDLPTILQADPSGLAAEDGRVYFGELRQFGTFDFGDEMISQIALTVDGAPTQLEAMSVMVHPETNVLPFETPVDGVIAMSVCTVDDPSVPPEINALRLYSGIIAYPVDGLAALSLSLPNQEAIEVEMVSYVEGQEDNRGVIMVSPGETITFDASTGTQTLAGRLGLGWLWQD